MNMDLEEIKKKRETCERKIEDILTQFEKELPPGIRIDNAVAFSTIGTKSLICSIKLVVEGLNK